MWMDKFCIILAVFKDTFASSCASIERGIHEEITRFGSSYGQVRLRIAIISGLHKFDAALVTQPSRKY